MFNDETCAALNGHPKVLIILCEHDIIVYLFVDNGDGGGGDLFIRKILFFVCF